MNSRFVFHEFTLRRAFDGILRRIGDLPNAVSWTLSSGTNLSRLTELAGSHSGQRCFVMANGPSLARMDLALLKKEISFGLNRIYLLFDQLQFHPTYYVCINELVIEQFADEISTLTMPKFLNWNKRSLFNSRDTSINFIRLSLGLQDGFARDFTRPLWSGGTVTYVALQLAFIMGFSEVVLIGLDHSFSDKGTPNKVETRSSETDINHFHPNYFPKGSKWQLPDLKRSEIAYELARRTFEQDGRRILDATVGGKCQVFEKVDFYSLF